LAREPSGIVMGGPFAGGRCFGVARPRRQRKARSGRSG
jgi:hypothetical protein